MHGLRRRRSTPRTVSLPPRAGGEPAPVAPSASTTRSSTALDELERVAAADRIHAAAARRAPRRRTRRARAWPTRSAAGSSACSATAGWSSTTRPIRPPKPLAAQRLRARAVDAGRDGAAGRRGRRGPVARGYHSQVQPQDDSLALFHLDGGRRPIRQQDGQFVVGDADATRRTRSCRRRPTSPPASARTCCCGPIVQDTLFPTVCYVAGPNELAYLGQLRGVYEHFGVPMPLMYPRASATLVDSAALRFLTKYERAARGAAGAGRGGAQRAAQVADSRRPSKSRSPTRRAAIDAQMARADRRDAGARSDARGRRAIDARPDAARPRRRCTAR